MKKLKVLLGALALIASMALVGCNQPAGSGAGTVTGGAEETTEIVVFDPATYTGNAGEVVEVSGEKYLKVTPDGYNTWIALPEALNLKGKTTAECKVFAEAGQSKLSDCQFFVSLMDNNSESPAKIYEVGTYKPLPTAPTAVTASHFVETQWNKASDTDVCVAVQPVVQDAENGYAAVSNIVVYFGKITVK